jgi:alkanesulfonate monooxygenase SsuD/methylene tetrahydromethanopterin reductase-like flavin-dependent oxidoreductase (luciferase family)
MMPALQIYRAGFRPSAQLAQPYAMLAVNVVAAPTDSEARFLATSGRESFANLRRGMPTTLPPPNREFEKDVVPFGAIPLEEVTSVAMVGSAATVTDGLRRFIAQTVPDELIVVSHIYEHAARVRSLEILAEIRPARWASRGFDVSGFITALSCSPSLLPRTRRTNGRRWSREVSSLCGWPFSTV